MTPPNKDTVIKVIKALDKGIWATATTPAGLMVTLAGEGTDDVTAALRVAGYLVTEVRSDTVMVGGVDRLALLDAQIAALTAERDRLVAVETTPFVPALTPKDLAPKGMR
ncbi:hypothetical protein ACWGKS_27150 [Nocardiopsis sp. NPDC055879]